MKNADMPAMPTGVVSEDVCGEDGAYIGIVSRVFTGLTKREMFASTLPRMEFSANKEAIERLLGRSVNLDDVVEAMYVAAEVEARFRVIRADALLAELERTK